MEVTVFYSWQSDRPEKVCRHLIRDAANLALKSVGATNEIELFPRLDHDTKREAGMPEIADTILRKIERAGFFLADVTFVAEAENSKLIPNPNVLLELGFAARAIGWHRIICVMNEEFGNREEQIFNIRHRRLPITYRLKESEALSDTRSDLAEKIKNAIKSLWWAEHNRVADAISKLDIYCLTFLKQHADKNVIEPPPTNRVTIGAAMGSLDTSGFNSAVNRLLDLGMIRCAVEPTSRKFVYEWTYLAILALRALNWRPVGT